MPSPTIYYVRHGQTDWNAEQRFQGRKDIPLNELGRNQAKQNGLRLKSLIGDAKGFDFVASPLGRTRETMEIIRENMGLDKSLYRKDEALLESSYGDFEGVTIQEVEKHRVEMFADRKDNRWDFQPPNGESLQMTMQRIIPFFNAIERDTIVVAHGAVGRTVRKFLLGLEAEDAAWFVFPQDKVFRFIDGQEEIL